MWCACPYAGVCSTDADGRSISRARMHFDFIARLPFSRSQRDGGGGGDDDDDDSDVDKIALFRIMA